MESSASRATTNNAPSHTSNYARPTNAFGDVPGSSLGARGTTGQRSGGSALDPTPATCNLLELRIAQNRDVRYVIRFSYSVEFGIKDVKYANVRIFFKIIEKLKFARHCYKILILRELFLR